MLLLCGVIIPIVFSGLYGRILVDITTLLCIAKEAPHSGIGTEERISFETIVFHLVIYCFDVCRFDVTYVALPELWKRPVLEETSSRGERGGGHMCLLILYVCFKHLVYSHNARAFSEGFFIDRDSIPYEVPFKYNNYKCLL